MKTFDDKLNRFRLKDHPTHGSTDSCGPNGVFCVPLDLQRRRVAVCVVSEGVPELPLEHVSVHIEEKHNGSWHQRTPSWEDMCAAKALFFGPEECVVQYHPAESNYVNVHKHTLHLWRPKSEPLPTPPTICV